MFQLARNAAVLSALCVAINCAPLAAQSPSLPGDSPAAPSQSTAPGQQPVSSQQVPDKQPEAAPLQTPATQASPAQPIQSSPDATASSAQEGDQTHSEPKASKKDRDRPIGVNNVHNASLWHDPGNIAAKDMFLGEGGKDGQPVPPFKFVGEDMNGTNPKFDVTDANDKKWRVKLGEEARPEVVASRLLWAIGYYVNDDYVLHEANIEGLDIKRGAKRVHNGEQIIDARFARRPDKETKTAIWEWKNNPFRDTREFNGLRVMMAVLNNWDLKDVNNAVYTDKKTGHEVFLVSDVGATFATNTLETSRAQDKGNVKNYVDSKFITKTTATTVDFGTPGAPTGALLKSAGFLASDYVKRKGFEWIGQNVPREDARWIGNMLGQLTHEQLTDAFRAGHFAPETIEQYVSALEGRIAQLKAL